MTKHKATAPLRDAMLAKVVKERNAALTEVARLKSALKRIEKQWHKGVSKHEVIPDCSGCVARAALSSEKE
jgi:hypothetical protein